MPDDVTVADAARARGPFDVIVAFVTTEAEVSAAFAKLPPKLAQAGGLWIAWPKKSAAKTAPVVGESVVRRTGLATERLVDNKVCSVDERWSGLRFVVRLSQR